MKKDDKKRKIGSKLSSCFVIGGSIWMTAYGVKEMMQEGVTSDNIKWVIMLFVFAVLGLTMGIYMFNQVKREDENEKKDKETFSQRKQKNAKSYEQARQRQYVRKHKTLEKQVYWNGVEFATGLTIMIGVILALPCMVPYIIENGFEVESFYIWFIVMAIIAPLLLFYYLLGFPKRKFIKMVRKKGYSLDKINHDYARGKEFFAGANYVLIGKEYSILMKTTDPQIIRNRDILKVFLSEVRTNEYSNGILYTGQAKEIYLNVQGRYESLKIGCPDEGIAKALQDAFNEAYFDCKGEIV